MRPGFVQSADVNGDGKADLVIGNETSNNIAVLLGNGDGTFQPAITYSVGNTFPSAHFIADFNDDGKPDIAVPNALVGTNGGTISMLINKGDGTFLPATTIATNISPLSIAAGDFNGDGNQDLWLGGNGSSTVMFGNGNGTFNTPVLLSTGGSALAVALGDFNGDGLLDLAGVAVALTPKTNSIGILLNKGQNTFASPVLYPVVSQPGDVETADLNHDGKLDLIVSNPTSNLVSILLGKGDGTFLSPTTVNAGTSPATATMADLDGTGHLDLVISDLGANQLTIQQGNGDGTFGGVTTIPTGNAPASIAVADFNGDGKLDLAVIIINDNTVAIFLNATLH